MFYVYTHCKPDGTPFYVGKGHGKRAWNFRYRRNPHHLNTIRKYGEANILVQIYPVGSEKDAFSLEVQMIADLRANGLRLCNQTMGGEGASGRPMSDSTKRALAIARVGLVISEDARRRQAEAIRGRIVSAETREKLRQARIGLPRPPHVIAALVAANKGRKQSEQRKELTLAALEKARLAAADWHSSEEGLAWHREHGKRSWEGRKTTTLQCAECGKSFETHFPSRGRFCHLNCKMRAFNRRKREAKNVAA